MSYAWIVTLMLHLLPIWPDFNMGYINIETMEGLTE